MFLFGVFGGMYGENSCNVFLVLFMVLWVRISAMLCRRAVPMLWHAFMFLGLKFFPHYFFFILLCGLPCFSLKRNSLQEKAMEATKKKKKRGKNPSCFSLL
jgi:hypothetical protein